MKIFKLFIDSNGAWFDTFSYPLLFINEENKIVYANQHVINLNEKEKLDVLSVDEQGSNQSNYNIYTIKFTPNNLEKNQQVFHAMGQELLFLAKRYRFFIIINQYNYTPNCLQLINDNFNFITILWKVRVFDFLTGAYRREFCTQYLEKELLDSFFSNRNLSYLLIDINQFAKVNSFYSDKVGDWLLKDICLRLTAYFNQHLILIRMSADKFLVVANHLTEEQVYELYHKLTTVKMVDGQKIIYDIRIAYHQNAHEEFCVDDIYDKLSSTLIFAKDENLSILKYSPTHYDVAINKLNFPQFISKLFDEEKFSLLFQAVVNNLGQIIGFESLLRLELNGGIQTPSVFMEYLIQNNFTVQINQMVLLELVKILATKKWQNKFGQRRLKISVNIIPSLSNFLEHLSSLISIYKAHIDLFLNVDLEFEILERQFMHSDIKNDLFFSQMNELLKENNISIALDDFGMGHSSLERIMRCRFDTIKIDKCFVDNIAKKDQSGERSRMMIESIILFSSKSGSQVIAEGVESHEQFEVLKSIGVNSFQGYLFYKPQDLEKLTSQEFSFSD